MSRKISQFTGLSVIPSDSYLTLVSGSQNYKISIGDFLSAIGVTGDISRVGDDGVSILNQPTANVNQIRNLLASKGIAASVTASGGIEINADFGVGTAGFPILINADTSPIIRNLQAGENVSIEESGNELIINAGDDFTPINTVVVNSVADLPVIVGNTYFLEDNTLYIFASSFSIGDKQIGLGDGTTVTGSGLFAITLTAEPAAGSDPRLVFYSRGSYRNSVENITINAPERKVFDITSTVKKEGLFYCTNVFVEECEEIGTFRDLGGVGFNSVVFDVVTSGGFEFIGINNTSGAEFQSVNLDSVFINEIQGGSVLTLGSSTFDAFSFENSTVAGVTYSLITGLANGANINAGGFGTIRVNTILGSASTTNIVPSDPEWDFSSNSGLENSTDIVSAVLVNNATATTISGIGVITPIAGTWTVIDTSRFRFFTNGVATFDGLTDIKVSLSATFSVTRAGSGSDNVVVFYLFKNGVQVSNVESRIDIATGDTNTISLSTIITLTTSDTLDIRIANTTATNNVTVIDAQFNLVGIK